MDGRRDSIGGRRELEAKTNFLLVWTWKKAVICTSMPASGLTIYVQLQFQRR